jgi:predicted transcriptional regulator
LIPCEIGVKTVLPAIRALIARIITEKHEIKEKQTAEILGLSQSAISRYKKRNRGNAITIENVPEVQVLLDQLVNLLIYKPHHKTEATKLFCQTCKMIREKGLVCQLCKEQKRETEAENCAFCLQF